MRKSKAAWVLCSNTLPPFNDLGEDDAVTDDVLISTRDQVFVGYFIKSMAEDSLKSQVTCALYSPESISVEDIIAWAPLPEPFKAEVQA